MEKGKKEANKEEHQNGFASRVFSFIKMLTIEPMNLFMALSWNMTGVPEDQMVLFKTCMEPQFNLSRSFCENIENFTDTEEYSQVEAEMTNFYNIITIAEHAIPILLSFYLGSWSDALGRKPFIYACLASKFISTMMNLVNAIYLTELNRWVWLSTVILVQNLSGGGLAYFMVMYSFIADNSTARQRTFRLGLLSFANHVASPAAGPIGAWLYDFGGYVLVFSVALGLVFVAALMGVGRLWSFEEKLKRNTNKTSLVDLVHPRHVVDSFKVTFKPRQGHKRTYMLVMMFTMLMNMMPYQASGAVQFLYVKRFFSWGVSEYSWYRTVASLISSVAMAGLFPLFHHFHVTDNIIIVISCLSQMGAAIIRGLSTHPWMFYLSAVVDMATSLVSPPIRAQMTRCVEPHELGKVFAMLASVESLVPILGTNIFTRIYTATKELEYPLPGMSYFTVCGFLALGMASTIGVAISLRCGHIPSQADEENRLQRSNSNRHPEDRSKTEELFCQGISPSVGAW